MAKGEINKLSFNEIYTPFQEEYTAITVKRSMPQDGTLPEGIAMLVQAVALNCEKLTEPSVAYGEMAKVDKMEESQVHSNLARISNAPFPLVESVIVENASGPEAGKDFPIKDIATGKIKAKRYTRVKMSKLGELLTRRYKKTSLLEFKREPFHKSIVPVSLLRPGKPITLGYSSTWLPLNPRELFQLMIKMIDQGTPYLPYRDVEDVFKGPDVGYGYIIRCTNESLVNLYQTGKGSFSITPEISIDKFEKTITFKKPPLDGTSIKLRDFLRKNIREGKYNTFHADPMDVKMLGVEVVISNVEFRSTAEEIYDEITGEKTNFITKQVTSTNTISRQSKVERNGYEETIYEIDIPHIPEVLWTSIYWEMEKIKEDILRSIKEKKDSLWSINLMRKLTYDLPIEYDIRNHIHEVLKIPGGESVRKGEFRKRLDTFQYHPSVPEEMRGFSNEEIDEIFKGRGNDVLATMHDSNDWAKIFDDAMSEINQLELKYNDEVGIRQDIKRELENLILDANLWRRKSKVYFESIDFIAPKGILIPSKEFDSMNLPISYFYSQTGIGKSFGRNMNIINDKGIIPTFSINATTADTLLLYTADRVMSLNPKDLSNTFLSVDQGNFIRGVIPQPIGNEKIMVAIITSHDHEGRPFLYYRIVDRTNAHILNLELLDNPATGSYGSIMSWSYIEPDKYMDMMYTHGILRIPTNELLANLSDETHGILPDSMSLSLLDIDMVDASDAVITIPMEEGFMTDTPTVTTMTKPKATTLDYRSERILGTHYEMYLDGTYLPDPTEVFLTAFGEAVETKKVSLPEWTPINKGNDKKTNNINTALKEMVVNMDENDKLDPTKVMRLKTFSTSRYKQWMPLSYQPTDDRII